MWRNKMDEFVNIYIKSKFIKLRKNLFSFLLSYSSDLPITFMVVSIYMHNMKNVNCQRNGDKSSTCI